MFMSCLMCCLDIHVRKVNFECIVILKLKAIVLSLNILLWEE